MVSLESSRRQTGVHAVPEAVAARTGMSWGLLLACLPRYSSVTTVLQNVRNGSRIVFNLFFVSYKQIVFSSSLLIDILKFSPIDNVF